VISDGPHRLDGPSGPVCMCGQPSRHESGWCGEEHRDPALKSFASEARERGPLDIQCPACTAKPGEHCAGVVDASKTFTEPHGQRIAAMAPVSDIERAQRARVERALKDGAVEACSLAKTYVQCLSPELKPLEVAVETHGLMIAVIAVCDAFGTSRELAIELFTKLARDLAFPSAVLE
jgi:hypothetical protein